VTKPKWITLAPESVRPLVKFFTIAGQLVRASCPIATVGFVMPLFSFRPCSRYPCPHKVWNTKQGRSWGQPCSARYYSGLYAAFVSFPDIVAGGIRIPSN
jgi:hypothetical protein